MPNHSLSPTREEFSQWVYDVLNHLYDSPYLHRHPLTALLVGQESNPRYSGQQMRRVVLEAIRGLRPGPGTPAQSPDWRGYRILELRYIEGLGPREAMERVFLGKSQYYREQTRVLEELVAALWDRWQERVAQSSPAGEKAADGPLAAVTRGQLAYWEAERLCANAVWEEIDVEALLRELRSTLEPLARAQGIAIHVRPASGLVVPRGDRVLLRQAILNAISYGLDVAGGSSLVVSKFSEGGEQGIRIQVEGPMLAPPPAAVHSLNQRQGIGFQIAQQLIAAMGGALSIPAANGDEPWEARITWPVTVGTPVLLVIDDNPSFIDLFRRYLVSHGWKVMGAVDGAWARQAVAAVRPTVIVLDVMMPKEDGWELLKALKARTETRDIPVVVCSVLNEPQLAVALGAVGYLPKPVSQPALLQALAPWHPGVASRQPGG